VIHNKSLKKFYFIESFNKSHIKNLDKDINIIYRNYKEEYNESEIFELKKFCYKLGKKLFLSNNINMTIKLKLDGAYIPAFNKDISVYKLKNRKIQIIGSAHNLKEINEKKKQGVQIIFLSPLFKVPKSSKFLGISKFNILANTFNGGIVALGGITKNNIRKLKLLNCFGLASISYIKENTISKKNG
jgi:thiamine-phosphate pyrophosphorylase|tara:strand:- start:492 stop:1052 length:561 start_codon:yes stop_codon:yes gene_type:complete